MKKVFLKKMKALMLAERAEIEKSLTRVIDKEAIDLDGDETDEIQGWILLSTTNGLAGRDKARNRTRLEQIERALKKIEEEEYGDCERCGEEIAEKRLEFAPFIANCIACAEQLEKTRRQFVR
jgi:DnaK suppressor protein